ncbi:HAD family hydrolase [Streptomyces sp. DSM 44917]|uniref:HAD family hydrolase n=1 Tax=Streptomyces boetiae TaxID=3075541 RepID=A0ABU2LFB2_9ACTN|nr:HAD family hydrolase [Streptomyces sp. DSM 44917]MDT0309863.1 HAD family hydrolase [Streptomyces sp. DSM 44917]
MTLVDRFPYRLVATDLDGTLLRRDHTVSARTRAALSAAQAAGADHLVVTGRSVSATRHILDDLGYRGLAVCGQGAQLYHSGEHRLLTSVTLDRALARAMLERLENGLGPLAVAASRDGLDGDFAMDDRFRAVAGSGFETERAEREEAFTVTPDRSELFARPLLKLYLQQPGRSEDELIAAARPLVGDQVNLVISGEHLVEMLPAGLTKVTGLSLAARRLGVTAADTIAFGDMPNDIPMLRWSAHGVAMAAAHPEVLAVADEVTGDNDADGIAEVIERLLSPAA